MKTYVVDYYTNGFANGLVSNYYNDGVNGMFEF